MDQRTRKLMTMYLAFHPRDDVDILYVLRIFGGRGVTSIEVTIEALKQRLEDYVEKGEGRWITATRNNCDNTGINRMKKTA